MASLLHWWRNRRRDRFYYAPSANGRPDAGEVCWAWVPFEDDPGQGKDRPVLLVGRRGRAWLALMLTSKDRAPYAGVVTDRFGRVWLDVGMGTWDRQLRPSEVRLDRLLVVKKVRREGGALNRPMFDKVLAHGQAYWA